MASSDLSSDNLFQLNTVIWASFPQPVGAPVTPVLKNSGYDLFAIEKPLDASLTEKTQLNKVDLEIQPNPVADVVLFCAKDHSYPIIECKPSSFGLCSGWTPQARGMVVAAGSVASRLGVSGRSVSEMCYLVPADDTQSTDATLVTLQSEIVTKGLRASPTGVLGLSVRADGVYLGLTSQPQGLAQLPLTLIPEKRVLSIVPGQDPRPLYVIPWIPDVSGTNSLDAFKEKIRAMVLSWLGKTRTDGSMTLGFEELLNDVSRGIFQYWGDKSSLCGRVFPTISRIVRILFADDVRVTVNKGAVTVALKSGSDRDELMEKVRTVGIPEKLPEGVQLGLDEQLPTGLDEPLGI